MKISRDYFSDVKQLFLVLGKIQIKLLIVFIKNESIVKEYFNKN